MAFNRANWIWRQGKASADEFVDFICTFEGGEGDWRLQISADSDYNVYINGNLAAFGQYADYPSYKVYDDIDVSPYVRTGNNRMVITVWYYGIDTQTYIKGDAGLIFELTKTGTTVAYSNSETRSRLSHDYISWRCKRITSQLGLTYRYDATKNDGYLNNCDGRFGASREMAERSKVFFLRPTKKLELGKRMPARVVRSGSYKYVDSDAPAEIRMRDAELCDGVSLGELPQNIVRHDGYDGIFVIVDVGNETAGFLDMDITLPTVADIDIGYGEHIIDGRCRTSIGSRSFTASYIAKAGHNSFLGTFRRFGGRYIQIFVPAETLELNYLGIRPTEYPVRNVGKHPSSPLRTRIYDVAVNTLRQCMHEHYEDCPWREQALYTMDSRNQMLCGYYAFEEYEFARASLLLISKGVREDGLLSLCYPAGLDFPIPSFSLMYFVQMWEYIKYSNDITLADELYEMLTRLMNVFVSRIDDSGLILSFADRWNFYEWSDGMSGSMRGALPRYEAPLNAFLVLALRAFADISMALRRTGDFYKYTQIANYVASAITKHFYNTDAGLFESYDDCGKYSVLTNSLCLLCGAAENVDKHHILEILSCNGKGNFKYVITPNTLSMNSFRFDALLAEDRERYAPMILDEIDRDYGYMLNSDATSFWETIFGAADFGGAGSLCHGWSALPIYYYSILDND
ncbi:MAG: family 78 glycoside hydrolase catalytic domain [Clostridia bacterium]|nr:family 78 glycoside hydrolase catalytic domain [Clostridia bacterium]